MDASELTGKNRQTSNTTGQDRCRQSKVEQRINKGKFYIQANPIHEPYIIK